MQEEKTPPALYRWLIWLAVSLAMFGNYYLYDSISPLADLLKSQLQFSDANIGTLQAIYSLPNIFMVLIGGVIIDRIGSRRAALLFAVPVMLGGFLTAVSGELWLMATGRLLFGLGAESMIVAINTVLARWFKGKQLALAFGTNLTIARLGSFMALNSPSWAASAYDSWQSPLWLAALAGVISLTFVGIYFFLDYYAARRYPVGKDAAQDKVELKEIFHFGPAFWYITLLCVTFYSAMFPFQTFAVKFFQDAHGVSREAGGFLSSILTFSSMLFTPLFGLLSDHVRRKSLMMMFGSMLIIPVYLLMGYGTDPEATLIPIHISFLNVHTQLPLLLLCTMGVMGIAFSMVPAVMWPSVALLVESRKLGTAYGLMMLIQNIGLGGFNYLIGTVNDWSGAGASNASGYIPGMWVFSILGFAGCFFAFMLHRAEVSTGGYRIKA